VPVPIVTRSNFLVIHHFTTIGAWGQLLESQQFRQLGAVKSYYNFIIHEGHWCGHHPALLQLTERGFVLAHIPVFKSHALLRKKLFRLITEHSTRLAEDNNLMRHRDHPFNLTTLTSRPRGPVSEFRYSIRSFNGRLPQESHVPGDAPAESPKRDKFRPIPWSRL
jgi:aryl carrier-like protein